MIKYPHELLLLSFSYESICSHVSFKTFHQEAVIHFNELIHKGLSESSVGERIHRIRMLKGASKEDVALYIGIKPQSLDSFEFGTSFLSPDKLLLLARYLNTPVEYFYDKYYEFVLGDYDISLKTCRKAKGLSQKNAAKLFGVAPLTLSRWENRIRYPNRVSYEKLVDVIKEP